MSGPNTPQVRQGAYNGLPNGARAVVDSYIGFMRENASHYAAINGRDLPPDDQLRDQIATRYTTDQAFRGHAADLANQRAGFRMPTYGNEPSGDEISGHGLGGVSGLVQPQEMARAGESFKR